MKIIITAAGEGKRFEKLGINTPKYKLIANEKPLFYWAVNSLKDFNNYEYIFVFRKEIYDKEFVDKWIKIMGINSYKIHLIDFVTKGQAETAILVDQYVNDEEEVMIYNIDTMIYPESMNNNIRSNDGTIVVAKANGDHWSFAKVDDNGFVCEVSEKIRISDYASVGPYYFSKWKDFKWVFNNFKNQIIQKYNEIYICPMYKYLIDNGKKIGIYEIKNNDFVCLGTPNEIEVFDKKWLDLNK